MKEGDWAPQCLGLLTARLRDVTALEVTSWYPGGRKWPLLWSPPCPPLSPHNSPQHWSLARTRGGAWEH